MCAGTTSTGCAPLQRVATKAGLSAAASPAFRAFSSVSNRASRVALQPRGRQAQAAARTAAVGMSIGRAPAVEASLKVAVTGAGGRTGGLTVKRLLEQPDQFSVTPIVRSQESAAKLEQKGLQTGDVVIVDITASDATEKLQAALAGADALVIGTSGSPQMKPKPEGAPEGPPEFFYPEGQMPEQVDYQGQVAQIEAAKAAGVRHVVIISSMGGTDESNRLNALGGGKILVWKRKAEQHLIDSGLTYTIIHPGGLFDEEGGQREIVLGVDDELLEQAEKEGKSRRIPRDDVAALVTAALTLDSAKNRSVDAIANEPGDGVPTTDFDALYAGLQDDCKY